MMVDNSMRYHDDVTIFNFTAVEYDNHPLYHRHRVVEMALCTLSNGSPLQFNGRYHHMLETGRFHMCMMSGVLTSLQMDVGRTADHEPPLDSMNSFSEAVAIRWLTRHRAEYGLATMKPSKPFSTGSQTQALGCLQLWLARRIGDEDARWILSIQHRPASATGFIGMGVRLRPFYHLWTTCSGLIHAGYVMIG